jgi:anti-sigma B factor antagonist
MGKAVETPRPNRKRKKMMSLHATHRDAGQVTVVDLSGRITLGDGSALLRKTIRGLLEDQRKMILLNLADVDYIDSSGIGELVSGYTAVKNQSGDLKLLHLTKKVRDLLQITKLFTVFDVFTDESTAVRSFTQSSAA